MSNFRVKLTIRQLNKMFSKLKPEDLKNVDPKVKKVLDKIKRLKNDVKSFSESDLQDLIISINELKVEGLI